MTSTSVATGLFLACVQTFPSPQTKIGKKDGEGIIPVFIHARDTRNCVLKNPSSPASPQTSFGVRSSRIHFSRYRLLWRAQFQIFGSLKSALYPGFILRVTGNIQGTLSRFRERLNHRRDSYQEENNFARIFWIKILSDFYC